MYYTTTKKNVCSAIHTLIDNVSDVLANANNVKYGKHSQAMNSWQHNLVSPSPC